MAFKSSGKNGFKGTRGACGPAGAPKNTDYNCLRNVEVRVIRKRKMEHIVVERSLILVHVRVSICLELDCIKVCLLSITVSKYENTSYYNRSRFSNLSPSMSEYDYAMLSTRA